MTRPLLALLATLVLAGCAGRSAFEEGRRLVEASRLEQGLARVEEAARLEPGNPQYRSYYVRQRDLAVYRSLALAESARRAGLYDEAETAYRRALELAPANARAQSGLEALGMERRHRALLAEAQALLEKDQGAAALAKARAVLAENSTQREALELVRAVERRNARAALDSPRLAAALQRPVTLEFRDASLRTVLEIISRQSGLNFVFDRDVRPDLRTTVFVKDTPIDEAIRIVLLTSQLERRVLNEQTILVYPDTPAKTREYRELVMKSFYLTNADAKQTANMLRALVKTRDLYVDEKLNLVVMRDTPEAVRVAERLVANQDLGEPEVVLEVEVLEVGTTLLQDLGVQWPGRLSAGLIGAAGIPGTVSLPEWLSRDSRLVQLTFSDPLFVLNLQKQDGSTSILANPRIRVKNKEKARIHIGDKVPVITTTQTATGFASESVTYLDTGLKLEVEANVYLDNDVAIKLGLEVSSISATIRNAETGTTTYQVGTRNAATVLRLKDGETQMLAGLISDEERRGAVKVPGLGDLPVLGRLFSSTKDDVIKTEIVLLVTPHVVRNLARPEARFEEFLAGTEASIGGDAFAAGGSPMAAPQRVGFAPPAAPAVTRFSLQAPPQVAPGEEFSVQLGLESAAALRGGTLAIGFDGTRLRFVRAQAGELLAAAGGDAALRASAEAAGRLSLAFEAK
ncbi:MAG TPA: secretin N-terminal domain-containing protein, partial [Burkholderiales bacterium]|nr:secretin N-terminal domain-containing protein [Burkholderiales bacterium]